MNGFRHVDCEVIIGGHWWSFDRSKYQRLVQLFGTNGAKVACYVLKNERWSWNDNQLRSMVNESLSWSPKS